MEVFIGKRVSLHHDIIGYILARPLSLVAPWGALPKYTECWGERPPNAHRASPRQRHLAKRIAQKPASGGPVAAKGDATPAQYSIQISHPTGREICILY